MGEERGLQLAAVVGCGIPGRLLALDISTNSKKLGTAAAGGYVWHTTGSGKTLTSSGQWTPPTKG